MNLQYFHTNALAVFSSDHNCELTIIDVSSSRNEDDFSLNLKFTSHQRRRLLPQHRVTHALATTTTIYNTTTMSCVTIVG